MIKGYCKWYGVSEVCAILELRMQGIAISEERLEQAKQREASKSKARAKQRAAREEAVLANSDLESDEHFAYIAGYTSWGFAYGVTWEEMEQECLEDNEFGLHQTTC